MVCFMLKIPSGFDHSFLFDTLQFKKCLIFDHDIIFEKIKV